MMLRKVSLTGFAAAAFVVTMAGAASAGEVSGNGKDTPIRDGVSNSICAFSGLNNDPIPDGPGRTQSYGQDVRTMGGFAPDFFLHPGNACNGRTGFLAGD